MDDAARQRFWDLQRSMNTVSSQPERYEVCCRDLKLSIRTPKVGAVELEPWQVTRAWWILYHWKHGLGNALLADDVGLGKTIEALSAVQLGINLALDRRRDEPAGLSVTESLALDGPYKPTLVVCPASAFGVWKDEIRNFPQMRLSLWVGSPSKAEVVDRHRTIGTTAEALREHAAQFDDEDPNTALQVVLTTYQTFHTRLLEFVKSLRKRAEAGATVLDGDSEDDEDEGMHGIDDDEPELSEEEMRLLSTKTGGLFGIVLADESHKLKTVRTRTHQAIAQSGMERFVLITATPTINRSADLFGTLSLLWNHLRPGLMVGSICERETIRGATIPLRRTR
jgi:SNF2 family DNA or RNA helicase